jgi:hypothetical protein
MKWKNTPNKCKDTETKSSFFEKINNIQKSLAKPAKRKREKTQINKIRDEKYISTNTTEIQWITKKYFKNLYSKKLQNLQEIDKFLDAYDLLKIEPRIYEICEQICKKQVDLSNNDESLNKEKPRNNCIHC